MRRSTWPILTLIGFITHTCTMVLTSGCASVRNPDFNSCRTKQCKRVTVTLSSGEDLDVCADEDLELEIRRWNELMLELEAETGEKAPRIEGIAQ